MNKNAMSLTAAQLHRAADLKERIEALTKELDALFNVELTRRANFAASMREGVLDVLKQQEPIYRRKMSAEGRAAISRAMKRRWSKAKRNKANHL